MPLDAATAGLIGVGATDVWGEIRAWLTRVYAAKDREESRREAANDLLARQRAFAIERAELVRSLVSDLFVHAHTAMASSINGDPSDLHRPRVEELHHAGQRAMICLPRPLAEMCGSFVDVALTVHPARLADGTIDTSTGALQNNFEFASYKSSRNMLREVVRAYTEALELASIGITPSADEGVEIPPAADPRTAESQITTSLPDATYPWQGLRR